MDASSIRQTLQDMGEPKTDDLYRGNLEEFVSARNALAKTLSGDERKKVSSLQKPTVVPWAVNQTYWRARPVYDDLLASGRKLRAAQLAALKGKKADVRAATTRHREAIAKAVTAASRLAAAAGLNPPPASLQQMFEALSLQETLPEPHGRLTKPVQLAGFEALSGVSIAPPATASKANSKSAAERRTREREEAEQREKQKAITKAEARVERAEADEKRARADWEQARDALEHARRALAELE